MLIEPWQFHIKLVKVRDSVNKVRKLLFMQFQFQNYSNVVDVVINLMAAEET